MDKDLKEDIMYIGTVLIIGTVALWLIFRAIARSIEQERVHNAYVEQVIGKPLELDGRTLTIVGWQSGKGIGNHRGYRLSDGTVVADTFVEAKYPKTCTNN